MKTNENKYSTLLKTYPDIFSSLWYGIECGEGWSALLEAFAFDLRDEHALILQNKSVQTCKNCNLIFEDHTCDKFEIDLPVPQQIKSKFGGLRIYLNHYNGKNNLEDLIKKYEEVAIITCERCGKAGCLDRKGWWTVKCGKCVNGEKSSF